MIRHDFVYKIADKEFPEERKRNLEFFKKIYDGKVKLDKRQDKAVMPDGKLRSIGYDMEEYAQELADQGYFKEIE